MGLLSNLMEWEMSLPMDCMTFKSPFQPKPFCGSMIIKSSSNQSSLAPEKSREHLGETCFQKRNISTLKYYWMR